MTHFRIDIADRTAKVASAADVQGALDNLKAKYGLAGAFVTVSRVVNGAETVVKQGYAS